MLHKFLRSTIAFLAIVAGSALLPSVNSSAQAQEPGCYDCQQGNCNNHGHHGHARHHGSHGKHGQCYGPGISSRDLFYNYYVGPAGTPAPNGANSVAAMYPSPLPTPQLVGHTYITYQPLLPHEFLYTHKHQYCSSYPGGGQVTTKVRYGHSVFGQMNPWFGNRAPRPRGPEYLNDPLRR